METWVWSVKSDIVDGTNPAPVDRWFIPVIFKVLYIPVWLARFLNHQQKVFLIQGAIAPPWLPNTPQQTMVAAAGERWALNPLEVVALATILIKNG